nr:MAG TPA: hypothetical protein [Caudoviricetes sp.]
MKWIELKDGNLVNLENVTAISYYAKECAVYFFVHGNYASEKFETPELAKARMRDIKAMLDYEPTTCN